MRYFDVPVGRDREVRVAVPDGVRVQVVVPKKLPVAVDVEKALRSAISSPIASPPLRTLVRPGQRVAMVVTDITRKLPEEIILPILLEELSAGGVRDGDITVVVGTGTHRPNTPEEMAEMFGADLVRRLRFINHDAWDKEGLKDLGKTRGGIPLVFNKAVAEADIRITTGVIEPHLFAGYSGGVKTVAIGAAGEETIAATHNYDVMKETRLGVLEGNRFRAFLTEASLALGVDFIVNVVQTGDKKLVAAFAGHPVEAFHAGVRVARQMYEVPVEGPVDVVVSSANYPKSRDLYQATRAANAVVFGPRPFVKKGGAVIVTAPCEDGLGFHGFREWMMRAKGPADIVRMAREEGFAPGEQKALILSWILLHARLVMAECLIPPETLREVYLDSAPTLQEALDRELARRPRAEVAIMPDGMLTLPIF